MISQTPPTSSPPAPWAASGRSQTPNCREVLKERACARVDALSDLLVEVSHQIHDRPELAFREFAASSMLADIAGRFGMLSIRPFCGLSTAFRATSGSRGPRVVFCCEYDALPDIGHGCGHNVVAAAGLGAALALVEPANRGAGRVALLGTPAEEGGGGKIILLRRGAFCGATAVLLAHPGNTDSANARFRAAQRLEVRFAGRAAHAAMAPAEGRNALDAAISAYQGLSSLRAALGFGETFSAILSGGHSANVVPDRARLSVLVRAPRVASLRSLVEQVDRVARAGAYATGCSYSLRRSGSVYADFAAHPCLVRCCEANMRRVGRHPVEISERELEQAGSTDLANVSQVVAAAHPKLAISSAPQHSAAFAQAARGPRGDAAVVDAAKILAMTAIDVWCDGSAR